ncbi:uncharacterized protein LOC119398785 [Rhipicephalus sanguineus]|uniref:uncharacterized protein LOC119398785 n=1 Tax=Rhipicephalus sanguineus TaxID=34632 RepID=UPI0018959825|nr:uncharacterized protein LOC119398785 [Rhipicephalus sanguineus]
MLCSSKGAVSAAQPGRGIRFNDTKTTQDYQIILPQLPTGLTVTTTVFLHADVKARPYRVEHFRDSLDRLQLMPEVVALGAYQMNHVWAITFKDESAKKKILSTAAFTVKDHRCVVIDPSNQDVRMKLYWLLHTTPDEDVRSALAPYGTVSEISREKWRVQGCADKGSHTRLVSLRLKAGYTVEDLPHQLRVGEDHALVHVPGRPPLCLRCRGTGHIRRECRVPRCGLCRRYGHDETQCVRSYANVTGSGRNDAVDEHVMDQADAEATVSGGGDSAKPDSEPQTELSEKNVGRKDDDAAAPAYDAKEIADADTDTNKTSTTASTAPNREESHQESTDMDCDQKTVVKRPREQTEEDGTPDGGCAEEPLPKTPVFRRLPMKFKPKVPLDKRTAPPADPP